MDATAYLYQTVLSRKDGIQAQALARLKFLRYHGFMNEDLVFAKDLAKKARETTLKYFLTDQQKEIKEDNTPVTIADKLINDMVMKAVKERYPDHGILAEEESSFNDEEYVWVCDPIDGTIAYNLTFPISTFALSLVHNGQPLVAVIYDPFMDRLWSASKGKGAFLNDTPIFVNKVNNLLQTIVSTSGPTKSEFVDVSAFRYNLQKQVFRLMQTSSTQLEAALVASGKMAGSIYPGESPHDIAAVKLIIEEAGGEVTNMFGEDQRYDRKIKGAVFSNGKIHKKLLKIVADSIVKA